MNPEITRDSFGASGSKVEPQALRPVVGLFTPRVLHAGTGEMIRRPSVSYWSDAWLRIKADRVALLSAAYIVTIGLVVAIGPLFVTYSHDDQESWNQNQLPSLGLEALVVDSSDVAFIPIESANLPANPDPATSEPPPGPAGIEVMFTPLTTGVGLKWAAVPGADGYHIYRSIRQDTDGVPLADPDAGLVSYLDQGEIIAGTEYTYSVYAYNVMGESLEPARITVAPKLALNLKDAIKIDSTAVLGATIKTNPHYLGTDQLGRDILSRLLNGGRVSLFIGFFAPLIFIFVGVLYGAASGFIGGVVDDLMMRFADMVSTVPDLLALIILQVFLGSGLSTLIIALVMVSWARSARQIRGEVLRLREAEFVCAARVMGTSTTKIITRHLLPNTTGTILVLFTLAVPQAIFTEAFLSYIGLGIKPPLASWGMVVNEGAKSFATYPHQVLVPALLISITMLAFNKLGDGLRDALDPKLRGAT
ncbi:MAG: ABC transporter permease subunit [Proteobacteria bacterium]|nr:ABC transporter permease subunit [Pseudomonadota bacterium]